MEYQQHVLYLPLENYSYSDSFPKASVEAASLRLPHSPTHKYGHVTHI